MHNGCKGGQGRDDVSVTTYALHFGASLLFGLICGLLTLAVKLGFDIGWL